jgi:hypothetical protein
MECKKTQYTTEQFALDDIERIRKKSTRDKVPTRAYFCKICNLWHLTSSVDWKESVRIKNLKITALIEALDEQKEEIKKLKTEIEVLKKSTNKEDRITVRADARVKEANERAKKAKDVLKRLRKDQVDLMCKNIQLQNKIDKYEMDKNK